MRYILAFLLLSFVVAAFLFQSKTSTHEMLSDDHSNFDNKEQEQESIKQLAKEKLENKQAMTNQVANEKSRALALKKVKKHINYKKIENQKQDTSNRQKKAHRSIAYKTEENQEKMISSKLGDYFIQDHLQVTSAQSYNESQGKVLAKSAGYYFVKTPEGESAKSFPIVVKKKNKQSLKLMTGIISIKSKSLNSVKSVASQFSLTKVQFFEHLNLYIYKVSTPKNIIQVFNNIQNSSGINQATLEILNKKVHKL